jgi:hypothetical protein
MISSYHQLQNEVLSMKGKCMIKQTHGTVVLLVEPLHIAVVKVAIMVYQIGYSKATIHGV